VKAEESPIFISEAQRREHIGKIKDEGINEIVGEKDRATYRRRLEEMAFVFFKKEEEMLARLCLAAALSLGEKTSVLRANPFLTALAERGLALVHKHAPASSLILP
jgi:hypothetical protein